MNHHGFKKKSVAVIVCRGRIMFGSGYKNCPEFVKGRYNSDASLVVIANIVQCPFSTLIFDL
jgi:hypothetical protein